MKKIQPMAILLKFEGYPPAVVASLFLHACLLVFILGRSVDPVDYMTVEDPVIITASAIDVNPQRLRRLERLESQEQQRQADEQRRRDDEIREQESREAREAQEAREREEEILRQEEITRQNTAEAERQRLAEEARTRTEAEEFLQQQRIAQQQAASREAQANQTASENLIVAEYSARIRLLIQQSWQIPPSARNGMTALIRLQLVPTGEVVGVSIVQSSGDAVFDRSVVQAVERADRFPELQELENAVFERNFRTFDLLFRPEDLLR